MENANSHGAVAMKTRYARAPPSPKICNESDKRVYEILSKKFELFNGVFGASDVALGALESGTSFEKTILNIYQKCNSNADFQKAFDRLDMRTG